MTKDADKESPILIPTPIEVEEGLFKNVSQKRSVDPAVEVSIEGESFDKHKIHISDETVDTKSRFEEK